MKKITPVLVFISLFLSCSGTLKGQNMTGIERDYFPLKNGAYWKYNYRGMQKTTIEIRITDEKEFNGRTYYQFSSWFTLTPSNTPLWLSWHDGAIYSWDGQNENKLIGPGIEDSVLENRKAPISVPFGAFEDSVRYRDCLRCADAGSTFVFARNAGVVSVAMSAIWGEAVYELIETNQKDAR